MELLGLPAFRPKYLMGDGHQGITSAGSEFLPTSKRIQCYYHIKTNLVRKQNLLPTPSIDWPVVNRQIWELHQAPSQCVFDKASLCLLAEWRSREWTKFAAYFELSCLKECISW